MVRHGQVWFGRVWYGSFKNRNNFCGPAGDGKVRQGMAWQGKVFCFKKNNQKLLTGKYYSVIKEG